MIIAILFLGLLHYGSFNLSASGSDANDEASFSALDDEISINSPELQSDSVFTNISDSLDVLLSSSISQTNRNNHGELSLISLDSSVGEGNEFSPISSGNSSQTRSSLFSPIDSLDGLTTSSSIPTVSNQITVPRLKLSNTASYQLNEATTTPRRYPLGAVAWASLVNQQRRNSADHLASSFLVSSVNARNSIIERDSLDDLLDSRPPVTGNVTNPTADPIGAINYPIQRSIASEASLILNNQHPFFLGIMENEDAKKVRERKAKRTLQKTAQHSALFTITEDGFDEGKEDLALIPILPIDSANLDIWLKAQLYLQNRAMAFQKQQYKTEVNLKDDLDLWSLLVHRGICKKNDPKKSLEWVKQLTLANGSGLEGALGQFDEQLKEYETYTNLFRERYGNEDNAVLFMTWFSSLPERQDHEMSDEKLLKWFKGIKKILNKMPFSQRFAISQGKETLKQLLHRKWLSALPLGIVSLSEPPIHKAIAQAVYMEIQHYKLVQLQSRLEEFYKEKFDNLPPITAEGIIDFAVEPINLADADLVKFMEGKHEKNEGVEEIPIAEEEIHALIQFIQTHREHAKQYIQDCLF